VSDKPTPKVCKFKSSSAKTEALTAFLRQHADDLPADAVKKATATGEHRGWTTFCDDKGIVAAMRYEHNDWYLCTVKNAAVRPDMRGKGLGRELYKATAASAHKDPRCLVLAADVTYDNVPSIKALRRAGFDTVNRFCWQRGQKPANIMHMVKLPTRGSKCP
jgi:ribosomal protein S18 acetylase RimI-like enzyme